MAEKQTLQVPGISEGLVAADVPISAAVRANGFVFVSGMPPMDLATGKVVGGDIATQTRRAIEAVRHILESAGSSLDKVVSTRVYCTNAGHFKAVNDVYREYFGKAPPARTFVTVGSWPMPFDIEIECVALE